MVRQLQATFIAVIFLLAAYCSNSAIANPDVAEKIYNETSNSIFTVYGVGTEGKKEIALGSAVAVERNVLATNCHVALSGSFLIIYVNDKPKLGRLYYYNQLNDLCLVEVPGESFNPVKIRASKTVKIGEEVFAIGNPDGLEKTISRGIISNKHMKNGKIILQTDAAISHGSSGGGLFDKAGNLIGITTFLDPSGENIGFAVSTELILVVVEQNPTPSTGTQQSGNPVEQIISSDSDQKPLPEHEAPHLPAANYIASYHAEITNEDKFNSKKIRLTSVRDILRQDRANYHLYPSKNKKYDENDNLFKDIDSREIYQTAKIKISHSLENKILYGNQSVFVKVYVYNRNLIEVIEDK